MRQAARRNTASTGTARRVLQQLFETWPVTIDESRTLGDFEGCKLAGTAEPLTAMGWRIRVKDRVFLHFGVSCDLDEPLSALAARIELAERGVRCTSVH